MLMKLRGKMTHPEGQKGFTLVELIVVMAILALLAALAVPRFTGILSDSKIKADASNVKLLQDAVDLYYANEGAYPDDFAALKTKKYIKEVPTQQYPADKVGANFEYTKVDSDPHIAGEVWDPNP